MTKKIVAALAAAALAAALLAGCAAPAASGAADSAAPSQSTASSSGAAATATPAPAASSQASSAATAASASGYDSAAFQTLLNDCIGYEADSAGGSLKAAMRASDLLLYISAHGTGDGRMAKDAADWMAGLTADQKSLVALNWPGILSTAESIAADPAAEADLLDTAGITTDFTKVDLTGAADALKALDGALSAQ